MPKQQDNMTLNYKTNTILQFKNIFWKNGEMTFARICELQTSKSFIFITIIWIRRISIELYNYNKLFINFFMRLFMISKMNVRD